MATHVAPAICMAGCAAKRLAGKAHPPSYVAGRALPSKRADARPANQLFVEHQARPTSWLMAARKDSA